MVQKDLIPNFRPRAVIFDLFNAVVDPDDFRPSDFNPIAKIAEVFNLDAKAFEAYWIESARIRNSGRTRKPLDLIEDYVSQHNGRSPTKGDLIIVDTLLGRYYDMALQNPKSEVVVALHNLKYQGLKLGLLANCSPREISTWFRSPISGVFEHPCFSCDTGHVMPAGDAYNHATKLLGTEAGSSVFVGGRERGSLKGARDAGFGRVIFMEGFIAKHHLWSQQEISESESFADVTIMRVSELEELLKATPAQIV